MAEAKIHDAVRIFYKGKLKYDKTFALFEDDQLEFTVGNGRTILGLELAVVGMTPGEEKTVEIPVEEAYGHYHEALVQKLDINDWPMNYPPPMIGLHVPLTQSDGRYAPGRIVDVSETAVTIDGNHPLAGRDVIFYIRLLEIVKEPEDAENVAALSEIEMLKEAARSQ